MPWTETDDCKYWRDTAGSSILLHPLGILGNVVDGSTHSGILRDGIP